MKSAMTNDIINRVSQKLAVLGLFLLAGVVMSYAQAHNPDPAWMVSKDVQKVANKRAFETERLRSTQIQAKSLSQAWAVSKGVNRGIGATEEGNIRSKGIPAWTISKGVQRIGR
ncbi:MAG: hypothetical protein C0490_03835 [Marivirga sp.]|nr:hypothetical protein [Marivirga sp.]